MSKLLPFARKKRPESEHPEREEDAELVLFTGVRYQRQSPDDESPTDARKQRENGS
ncbi:MAG: hypothetical protein KKH72_13090 [Alphaproteobacteria bacterium]|nr:hypothetical protein [Alphaproteobacteria bacterium]